MQTGHAGHVPTKAVLLIVGSVLCFTLLDTIVKHLAPHYPIPLLVWARLTFQAVAMLIWLGPTMKLDLLRTPRVGMQAARGILIVASSFLFMSALKYLPLAEATAISYSSPVLVMMMATLFLNEKLTAPRIVVVGAGIAGMLRASVLMAHSPQPSRGAPMGSRGPARSAGDRDTPAVHRAARSATATRSRQGCAPGRDGPCLRR